MEQLRNLLTAYQESNCTDCELSKLRTRIVTHRGNLSSKIVVIAEAPGRIEDVKGQVLIGPAGKLFDKYCSSVKLDTNKDLFLTNIVQCRPKADESEKKENRAPKPEEAAACFPRLKNIITTIQPKLIILLGAPSVKSCLNFKVGKLGDIVGKFFGPDKNTFEVNSDTYVMYHPSAILRQKNLEQKYKQDFIRLKDYINVRI